MSEPIRLALSALTDVWLEDDHGEARLVIHHRWGDTVRLTAAEADELARILQPMRPRPVKTDAA